MQKIERLLAKFGCKGQSYECSVNGLPAFSVEEQIGMVGICYRKSPVGWQCLMFEYLSDKNSHEGLIAFLISDAILIMQKWRGPLHDHVLRALAETAITESVNKGGIICGECGGSSKASSKGKLRKCPACSSGRIPWNDYARFAEFSKMVPVSYERFARYTIFLKQLVDRLSVERGIALLAIKSQLKKEENELRAA